jgi:hypothetical protein
VYLTRLEGAILDLVRWTGQFDAIDVCCAPPPLNAFSVVEVEEAAQNLIARGLLTPGHDGIEVEDLSWTDLRPGPTAALFA